MGINMCMAQIRLALKCGDDTIAELLGVTPQTVGEWEQHCRLPDAGQAYRIRLISQAANDCFRADRKRSKEMMEAKVFDGQSLLDITARGWILPREIPPLIERLLQERSHDGRITEH